MKTKLITIIFCISFISLSAQCPMPEANVDLEINGIKTILLSNGDETKFSPFFQYSLKPENSSTIGKTLISYTELMIIATNESGEIVLFDGKNWGSITQAGPLDADGETNSETCMDWDRFWSTSSNDVENFLTDWEDGILDSPVPTSLLSWPARGNPHFSMMNGFEIPDLDQEFAPFVDINSNGIYDPNEGDYPDIKGAKQAFYFIYNMVQLPFGQGNENKIEFHNLCYAYESNDPVINTTTFYDVRTINKSEEALHNVYMSLLVDPRLGSRVDDYFGCDTINQMAFIYNANEIDGHPDCVNGDVVDPSSFCNEIPMVGIKVLKGINAGRNFGANGVFEVPEPTTVPDTTIDIGLTSFIYFNNEGLEPPPPDGTLNPEITTEVYNYVKGIWADGTPLTIGGNGKDATSTMVTKYAFHGDPGNQDEWSMCESQMNTRSRVMMLNSGPFEMTPQASNGMSFAFVHVPNVPHPCPSLDLLQEGVNTIEDLNEGLISKTKGIELATTEINLSPNPFSNQTQLSLTSPNDIIESVAIYSISGQLINYIENIYNNSLTIQRRDMTSGIYFYKLMTSGGELLSGKFVVK